jgi:peroxiredoxin
VDSDLSGNPPSPDAVSADEGGPVPASPELETTPSEAQEAAAPKKGVPWSTFALLLVVALVLWNARPVVPDEAPLGKVPPTVSGIRAWLVPPGASAAPTQEGSLDFKALEGRVVLLEFYATWCPPCKVSLADLNERSSTPDLCVVLLTAPDSRQSPAEIRAFASQQRFPTALVTSEAIEAYGVRQIPYAVVVGRDGQVAWKGNPLESAYDEALEAALERR